MPGLSAARFLIGPAVALALLAGQVGLAKPAAAASHTVVIENYAYRSASLSVRAGDTVTWVNRDKAAHDVVTTSGPAAFRSPMLERGESWSYTFEAAGSYAYYCSVHPDMRAGVGVQAAEPEPRTEPSEPAESAEPDGGGGTDGSGGGTTGGSGGKGEKHTEEPGTASPTPDAAAPPTAGAGPQQPAASTPAIDPLLLLAGLVTAVAVFALLLLASSGGRPSREGDPTD